MLNLASRFSAAVISSWNLSLAIYWDRNKHCMSTEQSGKKTRKKVKDARVLSLSEGFQGQEGVCLGEATRT